MPSERHAYALRDEVNQFLKLVEQLNTAALVAKTAESATEQQELLDLRREMQQAVERMVEVAGKSDAELAEELSASFATHPHRGLDSKHGA